VKANLQDNLVSIIIPAYNKPDYTRQALQSIIEQEYRPIEVILSDDCSPISLKPVVDEFAIYQDNSLHIRYHRQKSNLGVMDNFKFSIDQTTGKYLVPFAHDNWFVDRKFLSEAVEMMRINSSCHLSVGNCVKENTREGLLTLPHALRAQNDWIILKGDEFIRLWLRGGMGVSFAVVIDNKVARELGAFEAPYYVSGALARKLDLATDNAMSYVYVLASVGSVAITGKNVLVKGTPSDSYSKSNKKWHATRDKVKFIIFYNIYRADLPGKYAPVVKKIALKHALGHIDAIWDLKLARYYKYDFKILILMGICLSRKPYFAVRSLLKKARRILLRAPAKKDKR